MRFSGNIYSSIFFNSVKISELQILPTKSQYALIFSLTIRWMRMKKMTRCIDLDICLAISLSFRVLPFISNPMKQVFWSAIEREHFSRMSGSCYEIMKRPKGKLMTFRNHLNNISLIGTICKCANTQRSNHKRYHPAESWKSAHSCCLSIQVCFQHHQRLHCLGTGNNMKGLTPAES